jgi:biopolymer transport protein ExbD
MRRKKKKRRTSRVPVASMGDIAFLLIIFFLVASEFNKDREVQMEMPKSKAVDKIKAKIAARVDIDSEGQIFLDGKPVIDAREVGVGIEIMLQGTVSDVQRNVRFRCDASQPKEVYGPVLQAIAEAGGIVNAVGKPDRK